MGIRSSLKPTASGIVARCSRVGRGQGHAARKGRLPWSQRRCDHHGGVAERCAPSHPAALWTLERCWRHLISSGMLGAVPREADESLVLVNNHGDNSEPTSTRISEVMSEVRGQEAGD